MDDEYKIVAGNWLDAIGNIISAIAEIRTLAGINDINNQLVEIGEGLQAVGNSLIGTVETDDYLDFSGNWIEGAGAVASSKNQTSFSIIQMDHVYSKPNSVTIHT